MYSKAEQLNVNNPIIPAEFLEGEFDLEQPPQSVETVQEEVVPVQPQNKFGYSTVIHTCLAQATLFSVGAAIRHHPVKKGAITALTGGAISGAIVGIIGYHLYTKANGNPLQLSLCSALLEWAAMLSTMPLGAQIVPFQQNLSISTLIEDQLVGSAVLGSPALSLFILLSCCLLAGYSQLPAEQRAEARSKVMDIFRNLFSTIDLMYVVAEAAVIQEAAVIIPNLETEVVDNLPSATMI